MIDLVPVVFVIFKVLMFGTCMFFAIKWHFDQGRHGKDKRAVLRAGGMVATAFLVGLLALGSVAFGLAKAFGLDLS